jgi:D-lactate dehydrogenase (cytochrome)
MKSNQQRFARVRSLATKPKVSAEALVQLHQKLVQKAIACDTNTYIRARHGSGESYHANAPPDLVAYPQSVQDIQFILDHCMHHGIPVIPFGAGTSLEGHVSAIHGGVSLSMRAHFEEIHYNEGDLTATVGAGVTRKQLNKALRATGMQFVVDPGADATIGGM